MTCRHIAALTVGLFTLFAPALRADVRTDEKVLVKLEGVLGRVVGLFGGKAAKEGVVTTVGLKGDRKATFTDTDGTIVDLQEEKVYNLDMKKKTYTVLTFDEMRRAMEEGQRKAEEEARKAQPNEAPRKDEKTPEMEVDFTVMETGQKKAINGFDTREVVMTVTLREKGKTLDQSGGLVMTSDMWLTPNVPAMKELMEFEIRYAKQLQGPEMFGASMAQMQTALATYPMLKEGLGRMAAESAKMTGTAILTTTTMDTVKSAEQMAASEQTQREDTKPSLSGGIGGALGGLARRGVQKKAEGDGPKARATFMTITNERLKITNVVTAADVGIPAGFREEKK